MDSQNISKLDPKTRVPDTLTVLQPGEEVLCTIRRHPIGILAIYALCALLIFVTAILSFALAPSLFSSTSEEQLLLAGTLATLIVSVACVVIALIATRVYWDNTWTLTSDSLTQVSRMGIFTRHSSQLSLEHLEDVSSEQNGPLTRLFNYGLLRVETAGERSKFLFPYCPNPNYYAAQILSAREAFERNGHDQKTDSPREQLKPQENETKIVSYEVPGGPDGSV